jgi:hypothetical protein
MHHSEFRRLFGADPRRTEPGILEHRASCAECAQYAADLERVDSLVKGALEVRGPATAAPPWENDSARPLRWYALAASLLLAVALGAYAWNYVQRDALVVEVVKHADHERNVLVVSEERVNRENVESALAKAGARLLAEIPVSIARVCKIRGDVAPHLVLQTKSGPVAVLLLEKERVLLPHSFEKLGYEVKLIPKGAHSIAIVGSSKAAVEEGAATAAKSIDWPQ